MANEEQTQPSIGRYANILLDRWFKRTFGWAPAKRLMQLFLQELIPERQIKTISYGPQEHVNPIEQGKDIRLDVDCYDADGKHFIVEVQVAEQDTFYQRAVFNSSFVLQEQVGRGRTDWDFAPIYFIGVVNFSIHKGSDQVLFRYRLTEKTSGEVMTDRLEYIFLEIPNCVKALTPEATLLDNFCYVLGNISQMKNRPEGLDGEIFDLLFNSAELSKFAPKERKEYIKEMTTERDRANQLAFAERKGMEKGMEQGVKQGMEQGVKQVAKAMLSDNMSPEQVAKFTGLSPDEIAQLSNDN